MMKYIQFLFKVSLTENCTTPLSVDISPYKGRMLHVTSGFSNYTSNLTLNVFPSQREVPRCKGVKKMYV